MAGSQTSDLRESGQSGSPPFFSCANANGLIFRILFPKAVLQSFENQTTHTKSRLLIFRTGCLRLLEIVSDRPNRNASAFSWWLPAGSCPIAVVARTLRQLPISSFFLADELFPDVSDIPRP